MTERYFASATDALHDTMNLHAKAIIQLAMWCFEGNIGLKTVITEVIRKASVQFSKSITVLLLGGNP